MKIKSASINPEIFWLQSQCACNWQNAIGSFSISTQKFQYEKFLRKNLLRADNNCKLNWGKIIGPFNLTQVLAFHIWYW